MSGPTAPARPPSARPGRPGRRQAALAALAASGLAVLSPGNTLAGAADLFGQGSRSASLAQADVAGADPAVAAYAGPTAAATPGARVLVGYARSLGRIRFQGEPAQLQDITGAELGMQYAVRLGEAASLGGALSLHLPDRGLARVSFRPASEPTFVRYEAAAHKTTVDAVLALRVGPVSAAVGAVAGAAAGGKGADVALPQDARGPHADGALDVELGYRLAPIVAVAVDLGPAALAFRLRGASSLPASIDSVARVSFRDNPLNGTTSVHVEGDAGYDPPSADLAARLGPLGPARAFIAIRYDRWRSAPPPVARFDVDIALGTSPSELLGAVGGARMRDTLSPRAGVELAPDGAPWAARAGYAYCPSPVVAASGFLTLVDAPRHVATLGGGVRLADVAGVDLSLDAHAALHLLSASSWSKGNLALPFADYSAGGHLWQGGLALTGGFR
jgi:hypothetical protein